MIKLKKIEFLIKFSLFFIISNFIFASTLKLGVVSDSSYDVANFIKSQGILKIDIIRFDNIEDANKSLDEKEIDLNLFQTLDQLQNYNTAHNTSLREIAEVYVDPIGIYSKHHRSIKSLGMGSLIAIPNGESNVSRSLKFLSEMGLIELDSKKKLVTKSDIKKNYFNIKILEVDNSLLSRFLEFADFVVISGEMALNIGYNPKSDSLFGESFNSDYINIVASKRRIRKNINLNIEKFIEAINSKETQLFLLENFGDNINILKDR